MSSFSSSYTSTGASKEELIQQHGMQPHPEGGFYAETFRSTMSVSTELGPRAASTAIYFLMSAGNISRLHRIKSDEVWHFYLGQPITVVELDIDAPGHRRCTVLGNNCVGTVQKVQYVVKRNTWFGSFPNIVGSDDDSGLLSAAGGSPSGEVDTASRGQKELYSFVGCTVAPGFEFSDFELGSCATLSAEFPKAIDLIQKMTIGLP